MMPILPNQRHYRCGILGATGTVGQRFIQLLDDHPWLKVTKLGASEKSVGRKYKDAVNWKLPSCLPTDCQHLEIVPCHSDYFKNDCGLDANVAGGIEIELAECGLPVFSNAKNHRYDEHVPILIPYINAEHIDCIKYQPSFQSTGGYIITNANCSSTGLSVALAPIYRLFGGIDSVFVTTLQAISGAGYPGLPSLDIIDNVVPFINGEEEKVEYEPTKILGDLIDGNIRNANIKISATCHRVPVTDGHTVSIGLQVPSTNKDNTKFEEIKHCLENFKVPDEVRKLPSCPAAVIVMKDQDDRPQPRLDRQEGSGMSVVIGRLRPCHVFDIRMTLMSHNTILGAAGGSILNAELAIVKGFIKYRNNDNTL